MMHAFVLSALLSLIIPMENRRFDWVHEQQYDFSCGAAALSSLADIYWNLDVDEKALLELLPELEDPRSFTTLLDLAQIAGTLGFSVGAFSIGIDSLTDALDRYGPALAHLNSDEGHFVLVIAITDRCIVVGDPSVGCVGWTPERFVREWSGVILAVRHESAVLSPSSVGNALAETTTRMERLVSWSARW